MRENIIGEKLLSTYSKAKWERGANNTFVFDMHVMNRGKNMTHKMADFFFFFQFLKKTHFSFHNA